MNNKILLLIAIILCCILTIQVTVYASENAYNWYCVRTKNHCQPKCEPDMGFIEKYNAFFIDKNHNDLCEEKQIYLTFDAGYENGNIERILDILQSKNVPAAFFILDNLIKSNTDLVKRMSNEGHLVCNHTASHKDMTKLHSIEEFDKELKKLEDIYREYTGCELGKYYRPPEGKFSEENLMFASELGYKTVFWSFAYADWDNNNQPSEQKALKLICDNLHNGAVLLLHPTSETNANILSDLIDICRSEGYNFGTLDQLTA